MITVAEDMTLAAPGIAKLGPFGPYNNSVWLFWHKGEAAVCEMPPYRRGKERPPWSAVQSFLQERQLALKYAMISHAHFDHCQSLMRFRSTFPETEFVAHQSQANTRVVWRLSRGAPVFDTVFDGDLTMLALGGEPLILMHAPKHSHSDIFTVFRGTAMTGDWFLGDLKDCNALVDPALKIRSVERVQTWLRRLNYSVNRAFSGHGDCLYYDVNFQQLLERSKTDHDLSTL